LFAIRCPQANPNLCHSVEGVEAGTVRNSDDAQLEGCEWGDDAVWYRIKLDTDYHVYYDYGDDPGEGDKRLTVESGALFGAVRVDRCASGAADVWDPVPQS
jgi:hypothetical protein